MIVRCGGVAQASIFSNSAAFLVPREESRSLNSRDSGLPT
jgi:hypothetical protein